MRSMLGASAYALANKGGDMESLGSAFAVLIWGGPAFGCLLLGATALAVRRWRKTSIAAMECADRVPGPAS